MATFPTNPIPRYNSTRGKKLEAIRSQTEAGYTFSRKKFTSSKAMYDLKYDNISLAEYQVLEDFFIANQGTVFQFTHPREAVVKNVIFNQDDIIATDTNINRCSTQIQLLEV